MDKTNCAPPEAEVFQSFKQKITIINWDQTRGQGWGCTCIGIFYLENKKNDGDFIRKNFSQISNVGPMGLKGGKILNESTQVIGWLPG